MGSHFLDYTAKCHGFTHRLFLCAFVEIQLRVHLHSVNRSLKSSSSMRRWQKIKMCKNYLKKENIYKHWSVARGDETPMPEKGMDQMRFKSILLCLALLGSCKHSRYFQAPCVLLGSGRKTDGSRKKSGWAIWRQVHEPNGIFQVLPLQNPSMETHNLEPWPMPLSPTFLNLEAYDIIWYNITNSSEMCEGLSHHPDRPWTHEPKSTISGRVT